LEIAVPACGHGQSADDTFGAELPLIPLVFDCKRDFGNGINTTLRSRITKANPLSRHFRKQPRDQLFEAPFATRPEIQHCRDDRGKLRITGSAATHLNPDCERW